MSDLAGGILSAIGRGGRIGTQTYLTQMEVERRAAEDAQRLNLALDKQDFLEKRVTREQLLEEMDREQEEVRYQDKLQRIAEEREDQIAQDEFEHEQAMLDIEAERKKPPTQLTESQQKAKLIAERVATDPEFAKRYTDFLIAPKGVTQAGARVQKQDIVKDKKTELTTKARRIKVRDVKIPEKRKGQPISGADLENWLMSQPSDNPYGQIGQRLEYWGGPRASDSIQAALRNLPWSPSTGLEQTSWGGQPGLGPKRVKTQAELDLEEVEAELGY